MAFVVWISDAGARKIPLNGVFETQAEANSAAAGNPDWTAHSGSVNDNVEPGDFINSAGSLLSAEPAAVRRAKDEANWKARIRQGFIDGWENEPRWRMTFGLEHNTEAESASTIYRYHQAALAWVIADRVLYASRSDNDRDSLVEHVWKTMRVPAYRRFADADKAVRDAWNAVSVADGQVIRTDLLTSAGVARSSEDGAVISVTGSAIPAKFLDTLQDG